MLRAAGARRLTDKNIEQVPHWGKNIPENCLVYLGRETQ